MPCTDVHPGTPCRRTGAAAELAAAGKPAAAAATAAGYCAARRCYCGGCPWWKPIDELATNTPDTYTAFDKRQVESGRRVSGERRRAAR